MIATAARLAHVSEYYFAGKLREIAAMVQAGHPVLNLGIGSPDLPPHPDVLAALNTAAADPKGHGYQSYSGIPALREAWAAWYQRHYGVSLQPADEILPLLGSKEGIVHIAMTYLEAGDEALVPNPGYPAYRAATLLAGATPRFYDLTAAQGWMPDLDALSHTDLSRVKLLWVNYPHMPTGTPARAEAFQRIVDFAAQHRILVINDNPYSFVLNDRPLSILAADGAKAVAIELNSLSKSNNMAGWRVGMIAGKADYLRDVLRFKSNLDSGQFLGTQKAAIAALSADEQWYRGLNDIYAGRQRRVFELLDALGCVYDANQQGLFVWARIPDGWRDGFALSDAVLYQKHVFITPGGIFGEAGQGYVRVSLCQEESVLREATARVQAGVEF
jgi:LL-diaminopimelate aminotransferase